MNYDDVRRRGSTISQTVQARFMPPWKPEPGYGRFIGERRLTGDQIDTVKRWVEGGAMEGDPRQLPPAPVQPSLQSRGMVVLRGRRW